jgi:hypothetical protein
MTSEIQGLEGKYSTNKIKDIGVLVGSVAVASLLSGCLFFPAPLRIHHYYSKRGDDHRREIRKSSEPRYRPADNYHRHYRHR